VKMQLALVPSSGRWASRWLRMCAAAAARPSLSSASSETAAMYETVRCARKVCARLTGLRSVAGEGAVPCAAGTWPEVDWPGPTVPPSPLSSDMHTAL
jgi:hypothetical protein